MITDHIVQMGDEVLRTKADTINPTDIPGKETQDLIAKMQKALATQNDGVALAAPQIGHTKRIFVVAPFIFEDPKKHNLVYINPEIIHRSQETRMMEEGCLSCRWKVGQVKRHLTTTIRAYDQFGNQFEEEASGLLAHIFQHETDHLDGILFIDKAENLRDMTEEEINEVITNS
jgi:peptide deformylase